MDIPSESQHTTCECKLLASSRSLRQATQEDRDRWLGSLEDVGDYDAAEGAGQDAGFCTRVLGKRKARSSSRFRHDGTGCEERVEIESEMARKHEREAGDFVRLWKWPIKPRRLDGPQVGIATRMVRARGASPWSRPGTISQETGWGEVLPSDRRGANRDEWDWRVPAPVALLGDRAGFPDIICSSSSR
jgi:hypothetical protein